MLVMNVITDEMYEKLIEYASKRCDAVMFVFCKVPFRGEKLMELEETKSKVKKKLEKSFLKDREGNEWVYTGRYYPWVGNKKWAVIFYSINLMKI